MKRLMGVLANFFHFTDKWLLFLWVSASMLSVLFLVGLYNSDLCYFGKIASQIGAIGLGLVIAFVLSQIDYNSVIRLWKLYLPVCLALVLATFVVGFARGGDQAWLVVSLGGHSFSMQPSELLKISFITTLSLHISKVEDEINSLRNILLLCLHGGAHILLIQLQDSGTALIFLFIFLAMLFCAGISWKYIGVALASMVLVLPVLWTQIMSEYHRMRVRIVFNPELDPDYYYQQLRSAIALGTGGLQGTGIFAGKHVAVPEVYNDFIFSFIGEASGFMGSMGVILLLSAIALKILYNSSIAKDTTGKFICIGVFAMIVSQTVTNLGMCLGVMPVIGVTLPLFSAGGTSVLALYAGLGLVLSTYSHANTALFYNNTKN